MVLKNLGNNVYVNEENIAYISYYTSYPYLVDKDNIPAECLLTFCGGNTLRVDTISLPQEIQDKLKESLNETGQEEQSAINNSDRKE